MEKSETDRSDGIFQPMSIEKTDECLRQTETNYHSIIETANEGITRGAVGVESYEGKGSDFRFTAVFDKQIADVAPGIQTEVAALRTCRDQPSGCRARLLLVDDDSSNQTVIELILRRYGYQVDMRSNGKEALQALEACDYDLVLMDCMMPVMNGYQTTEAIRDSSSSVRNHSIPVIALTANAFKEDRNKCLDSGMNDYLSKPLEIKKLLETLSKWLP